MTPVYVTWSNSGQVHFGDRGVVRNAAGIPYVVCAPDDMVFDGDDPRNAAVYKGDAAVPTSFSLMDRSGAPRPIDSGTIDDTTASICAAIDNDGIIHVAIGTGNHVSGPSHIVYATFDTNSNTWGGSEVVATGVWLASPDSDEFGVSIAVDSNDMPHIAAWLWKYHSFSLTYDVYYTNRIGGSWSVVQILDTNPVDTIRIIVDMDNLPFVVFGVIGSGHTFCIGDANNPSYFTLKSGVNLLNNSMISIALDIYGNHYVAYSKSSTSTVGFMVHLKADSWLTWQTYTTVLSGVSDIINLSMAIDGWKYRILFYVVQVGASYYLGISTFTGSTWDSKVLTHTIWTDIITVQWAYWVDFDSTGTYTNKGPVGGRKEISLVWSDYDTNGYYFDTYALTAPMSVRMIIEQN